MSNDEYPELVDWRECDSRGRVNLGSEFKNKRVKIAVIEVEDTDD
jgi:hypothetical protein